MEGILEGIKKNIIIRIGKMKSKKIEKGINKKKVRWEFWCKKNDMKMMIGKILKIGIINKGYVKNR